MNLSRRPDSAKTRFFMICHFLGGLFRGKISLFFGFLHVLETCYTAQTLLRSARQYVLSDWWTVCETFFTCDFLRFFSWKKFHLEYKTLNEVFFGKKTSKNHKWKKFHKPFISQIEHSVRHFWVQFEQCNTFPRHVEIQKTMKFCPETSLPESDKSWKIAFLRYQVVVRDSSERPTTL